jgi:hypothetical protein
MPRKTNEDKEDEGNSRGAEGYRKRTDRSRKLEEEMKSLSREADRNLD